MKTDRRDFLQKVGLGTAAVGFTSVIPTSLASAVGSQQQSRKIPGKSIVETNASSVADTIYGKVQGYIENGIYTFKGIPYGADTSGSNRFMPPQKPVSWSGIRSALAFGPTCPTFPRGGWANDDERFLMQWSDGIPNEDCLRINVWTPGLKDNKKRPVMVWIHGGGFTSGSSEELPAYDGENLCHRGDVVVVSMNHRLNVFGFLDLAEIGGAKYASSGNVGMLDLVAALEWVRDNISNFGGDPENVMIFGQSGGGSKVGTLMGMPSAKGLFHRAAVQSGSGLTQGSKENSTRLAAAYIAALGLTPSTLDQINTLPYSKLLEAATIATRVIAAAPVSTSTSVSRRAGWGPVVDGAIIPHDTFDPVAPAQSANIPMMIGTVSNESSPSFANIANEEMDLDQAKQLVRARHGDKTDTIIAAYQQIYPAVKPVELVSLINSQRTNAILQAERKAAQGTPVYLYYFTWKTKVLDGRPRSFHCSELAFAYDNIDRCINATGGTIEARTLAARMSQAWINFARTGNPNHKDLPNWPVFTKEVGEVMIFDNKCEVKNDFDREARATLKA